MQSRLRNFNNELGSFDHNVFNLGEHLPGRYVGFDTFEQDPNVVNRFILKHDATGISYSNPIGTIIGPCGVLLTPQGTLIREDAEISGVSLAIASNTGNPNTRYDLVVCQHEYKEVGGGEAATYFVVTGPNNGTKPLLADIYKQVIVGIIEVPPNAVNAEDCYWHKSKSPDSGDGEDARLTEVNLYTKTQGEKKSESLEFPPSVTDTHTTGAHVAKLWTFDNDGNTFIIPHVDLVIPTEAERFTIDPNAPNSVDALRIRNVPLQEGIRIHMQIDDTISLRESRYFEQSSVLYGSGYRGLKINPGLANYTLPDNQVGGGITGFIRPTDGEVWDIELVLIGNYWMVVKLGGAGSRSPFLKGDVVLWKGDIAANFDATGLGINLKQGWQLMNGLRGTDDVRGKILMGASNLPSDGRAVNPMNEANLVANGRDVNEYFILNAFSTMGNKSITIAQSNLPDYSLTVNDPGHSHAYSGSVGDSSRAPGGSGGIARSMESSRNTSASTTGITVNLGGGNNPILHTPPMYGTVLIMKL